MSYEVSFLNGTSLIVDSDDETTVRRVANERGVGYTLKNLSEPKSTPKKITKVSNRPPKKAAKKSAKK